jgi:hypothetical protein
LALGGFCLKGLIREAQPLLDCVESPQLISDSAFKEIDTLDQFIEPVF